MGQSIMNEQDIQVDQESITPAIGRDEETGSQDELEQAVLGLPENYEELLNKLREEDAKLSSWFSVALRYYQEGKEEVFLKVIDLAKKESNQGYADVEQDQLIISNSLAAYYMKKGYKERRTEKKKEFYDKAETLYKETGQICMFEKHYLLGQSYFSLFQVLDKVKGQNTDEDETEKLVEKLDKVNEQFKFLLSFGSKYVPAILGMACIAFNKKDYSGALELYRTALRINPYTSDPIFAEIRVGIGHCFMKLGDETKGEMAFERALELNPECAGALIGLAIFHLNKSDQESILKGFGYLYRAFAVDDSSPAVLTHLADHFFDVDDFAKVQDLSLRAFENTENETMKSESCYQVARSFHVQGDYDQAFTYYLQSTQFATESFVMPFFGLGQMYIHRKDNENAIQCFERVLEVELESYETMRILAHLYAQENNPCNRDKAKEYLQILIDQEPEDFVAWIELAHVQEANDPSECLKSYTTLAGFFRKAKKPIPPEILNNIGSAHYRLGNYKDSSHHFELALRRSKEESERTDKNPYFDSLSQTINYNLARLYEVKCDFIKAENLYKKILEENPNYTDCFLRLGLIAMSKGQMYEATEFFKDALQVDNVHPDAWTLIGNLHLSKYEWGPSCKKFERILQNPATHNDAYSMLAIGNAWLRNLYAPSLDVEKEKKNQDQAIGVYEKVLMNDPKNMWAVNGIGSVLAHKGLYSEAMDIFLQIRESTCEFCDVWLNMGHIYVENGSYFNAIQMYENCMKKFFKFHHTEILQYIGRAYYKAGKFREAKLALLKARRISPTDTVILYNLAFILQKLAIEIIWDEKSSFECILSGIHELTVARKYFDFLSIHGDRNQYDLAQAKSQVQRCQDLLLQAKQLVTRAKRQEEEQREIRRKQQEEKEAAKQAQLEQQRMMEEHRKVQLAKMEEWKNAVKERTKSALSTTFGIKSQKKRTRQEEVEEAEEELEEKHQDDDDDGFVVPDDDEAEETQKPKKKRKKLMKKDETAQKSSTIRKVTTKRKINISVNTSKTVVTKRQRKTTTKTTKNKKENQGAGDDLTKTQRLRIVSKEFISTDEDSTSEEEEQKNKPSTISRDSSDEGENKPKTKRVIQSDSE